MRSSTKRVRPCGRTGSCVGSRSLRLTWGCPRIDFHGLRQLYATAARRAGVDVEVLSQRLGHSDVAITLNVYRHVSPDDDRAAADMAATAILG